jgi:hypothetical protein
MHFARGTNEGDRSLDRRWVQKAKDVKRSVANVDLLSDLEIARWDLDTPERRPTGKKVASNWEYDPPIEEQNNPGRGNEKPDARERRTIRDGDQS